MAIDHIPDLLRRLYEIVAELEAKHPGRKFTPDGHLVGSIGEVLAAHYYDLMLLPASTKGHDARTRDGRMVQVKATHGKSVGLRGTCEWLLVLQLDQNGGCAEIYNGPGDAAWNVSGKAQRNGQQSVTLSTLRKLAAQLAGAGRIERIRAS